VAARCRGYSKAEKTYTFIESLALFHKFNEHVHLLVNGFETFLSRCDDLGVAPRQNCRQKVFNVGVRLCMGEVDILIFDKNFTDMSCFIFQFRVGGLSPPKLPVATGLCRI